MQVGTNLLSSSYKRDYLFREVFFYFFDREKEKADIKDKKVLEILQLKDNKIEELHKLTGSHQHEVDNLIAMLVTSILFFHGNNKHDLKHPAYTLFFENVWIINGKHNINLILTTFYFHIKTVISILKMAQICTWCVIYRLMQLIILNLCFYKLIFSENLNCKMMLNVYSLRTRT